MLIDNGILINVIEEFNCVEAVGIRIGIETSTIAIPKTTSLRLLFFGKKSIEYLMSIPICRGGEEANRKAIVSVGEEISSARSQLHIVAAEPQNRRGSI